MDEPIAPQGNDTAQQQADAPRQASTVYRVRVLGDPYHYEVGKVWPQGDVQTAVAALTYQHLRLATEAANAKTPEEREACANRNAIVEENLKKATEAEKEAAGSTVAYAIVDEIRLLPADVDTDTPPQVWVVGAPFGPWLRPVDAEGRARGVAISTKFPMTNVIELTELWPLDALDQARAEHDIDQLEREQAIPCSACGHQNRPDHLFCSQCGESLDDEDEEDDEPPSDDGDPDADEPTEGGETP